MKTNSIIYHNEYRETKTDRRVIPQSVDTQNGVRGILAKDCKTNEDVFIPFSDFESLKYVKVSR